MSRPAAYVIKAEIADITAPIFHLTALKTMYGGKRIAVGDTVFLFASETQAGQGLIARGIVAAAVPVTPAPSIERQTPRVSVTVRLMAKARRPLGRAALKPFRDWDDGRPETELNFKFYRQATNKIGGISAGAAAFLDGFF